MTVREWSDVYVFDRWMRGRVLYIHESGHAEVSIGRIEVRVPVYRLRSL